MRKEKNIMREDICTVCNEMKSDGINILGSYVCKRCEEEMIKEELNELKMNYYKNKMRNIWKNHLS